MSVVFRGSETPPLFASSMSMRKLPGFEKVITVLFLDYDKTLSVIIIGVDNAVRQRFTQGGVDECIGCYLG